MATYNDLLNTPKNRDLNWYTHGSSTKIRIRVIIEIE